MALKLTKSALPTLCNYTLLDKIADGGSGTVYRGRSQATNGLVAVKILNADLAGNAVLLKRFEQEFRTARSLDHPNLVHALDFGRDGALVYLVMELVEGESLGDRIDREGKLPEEEAIRIITQVAQALHHAHARGIFHRDVKPDNILLRADGQVKLTDLGLVKNLEQDADLTRPSFGLGTPHFMAPEQYANAKNVDQRCDIYALGATLYMAVTGVLPFHASNSLTALVKKVKGEIAPPRQLAPDLAEATDAAIRHAMHPEPTQRPGSCLQFIKELLGQAGAGSVRQAAAAARPASGRERRADPRHPCQLGCCCIITASHFPGQEAEQDPWPAVVQNLSGRGIGLLLGRRFEMATVVAVELPGKPARQAQVRHVRPAGLGHWYLGCAWVEPLREADIQTLV